MSESQLEEKNHSTSRLQGQEMHVSTAIENVLKAVTTDTNDTLSKEIGGTDILTKTSGTHVSERTMSQLSDIVSGTHLQGSHSQPLIRKALAAMLEADTGVSLASSLISVKSTDKQVDTHGTQSTTTSSGNDQTGLDETLKLDVPVSIRNDHGSSPMVSPSRSNDSVSVFTSPQISPRSSISSPAEVGSVKRHGGLTGQKKRKRRGSAWSDEQTEFLMEIWARHTDHKEGEEFNHNAPVYRLIARAMEEQGNSKTWEQCKTRIHTLKRAYKLTKDEITTGATNITYCRHFDKLEIIMGDNETTTPQMLADLLELRRKQIEENTRSVRIPQKRKLSSSSKPLKRPNTQNNEPTQTSITSSELQQPTAPSIQQSGNMTATNAYWYSQPQQQYQQQQQHQQHDDQPNPSYQYTGGSPRPFQSPSLPPPPPYPNMSPSSATSRSETPRIPEINNNEIVIKRENQDSNSQNQSMSTMTSQNWAISQTPQKEELEKMRLDLELRKIEMERNKLEMEERQRREERDHQYRMLQLLLFGLGQQNSAQFLSGQGVEQVVAQAQNSTNLSRALENGLVPGGPHTANEKGLSFNEI